MVTNTKSSRVKKEKKPIEKKGVNERQELFCQYFVFNDELRGNATQCYNEAYEYKLEDLPDDDAVWKGKKLIKASTRARATNVCSVEGRRLLRNPRIQDRLVILRNELLSDAIVDSKLAETIIQSDSYSARMMAIVEYNKLKQRVTQKVDLTSKGEAIKYKEVGLMSPTEIDEYLREKLTGSAG